MLIVHKNYVIFECLNFFFISLNSLTILVNRGWVSKRNFKPSQRVEGQVEGVQTLTAIVRKTEKRAPFVPENVKGARAYHYRSVWIFFTMIIIFILL